jgi:hypothetical protein
LGVFNRKSGLYSASTCKKQTDIEGFFKTSFGRIFCSAFYSQKVIKNKYTRTMVPSFIFLIFADIFMVLEVLFHGKTIFSLYRKIDYKKMRDKIRPGAVTGCGTSPVRCLPGSRPTQHFTVRWPD